MKGKFIPITGLDELPDQDKELIGQEFEWIDIGGYKDGDKVGRMMAPPRSAGFSFGWTPGEDISEE